MKTHRELSFSGIVILTVAIVLAVLLLVGSFWYVKNSAPKIVPAQNNNVALDNYYNIPTPSPNAYKPTAKEVFVPPMLKQTDGYVNPVVNAAVQWNSAPVKIADPKLILGYVDGQSSASWPWQDIAFPFFYQLGMHGDNSIIVAVAPAIDPSGPALIFFEKTPEGKYVFMQKMSTSGIYGYGSFGYGSGTQMPGADLGMGYALSPKVATADTTTFYEGLVGPSAINYQGLKLTQNYLSPTDLFTNYIQQQNVTGNITVTKVAALPQGDLYLYQQPSPTEGTNIDPEHFYIRRYILRLPSGLYTQYAVNYDFVPETYTPATITWKDGSKNKYFFDPAGGLAGCGNPGSYLVPVKDISQEITPSGTTSTGETVYEFKDIKDPVLLYFYHYWGGLNYDTGYGEPVSVESWYADHPVIVYKNALGDYTILVNEKYAIVGGCGKPVIYLYPTKPTNVNVQVGADITKSEPLYGNGWQVLANPDGSLRTAQGKTYDSLFWEGTGHGNYPTIDKGFVVPRADLKTALTSQLTQLGLNAKESADFMAFWLPKMPATTYVRLTWFTTEQMNELAPLVILPSPDTTIRIFLDFQGLQNKISLPAQQLTTVPRKGFTVIEWGGLLRK